MPPPLFTVLDGRFPLRAHDHVAVLYRERSEAFRLAPFLAEGLARGDLCHYLAPARFHAEMLDNIRALKVDPDPYLRAGTLRRQRPALHQQERLEGRMLIAAGLRERHPPG